MQHRKDDHHHIKEEYMEENTNLEVQESAASSAEESFEALIRGKYKPEFDARVQKIIEGRLKALHRENEALRRESSEGQLRLALQYRGMGRSRAAMEEMLRRAVAYGAQRAGQDLSRSLSGGRIADNGGGGHAAAVMSVDPSRLTAKEREEIRRRVARGEKVRFD